MQEIDFKKVENELLTFTKTEVKKFLSEHQDKVFYAFAFDCNAYYGRVHLCFNTEEDFLDILEDYQNGQFRHFYQTEEQIKDLKYSTGDWEYQCFSTKDVFSEDELAKIFDDLPEDDHKSYEERINKLLVHFSKALIEFCKTEEFKQIPKTEDFKVFCIDHDEDIKKAELRLKQLL